jgi:hypothetical protein
MSTKRSLEPAVGPSKVVRLEEPLEMVSGMPRGEYTLASVPHPSTWDFTTKSITRNGKPSVVVDIAVNGWAPTVHFPSQTVAFPVKRFVDKNGVEASGRPSTSIHLSDPALLQFLDDLDACALDFVVSKSTELFGKARSRDSLSDSMTTLKHVKVTADQTYPPHLSLKVNEPGPDKKFVTRVFVCTEAATTVRQGTLADVERGDEAVMVVRIPSLWVVDSKWGVLVNLTRVKLSKTQNNEEVCYFGDAQFVTAPPVASSPEVTETSADPYND